MTWILSFPITSFMKIILSLNHFTSTTWLSLGILVDIVEQDDECNEVSIKENLSKETEIVKIWDGHNCKDEEFQAKDLVQKKK